MSIPFANPTPQTGWQCPSCKRCYAPWVSMCNFCPTVTGNTSTISLDNVGVDSATLAQQIVTNFENNKTHYLK